MKYYSEETKKLYDSEEDLFKAEEEKKAEKEQYRKKLAEQVKRKEEVDAAYENYKALREAYVKDYGKYVYTSKDSKAPEDDLFHNFLMSFFD